MSKSGARAASRRPLERGARRRGAGGGRRGPLLGLAGLLVLGAEIAVLAPRAVRAAPPPRALERAGELVQALRQAEDEAARRELVELGADALEPLGRALGEVDEPAVWTRLAEVFELSLQRRLQQLEARLAELPPPGGGQERARPAGGGAPAAGEGERRQPAPPPASEQNLGEPHPEAPAPGGEGGTLELDRRGAAAAGLAEATPAGPLPASPTTQLGGDELLRERLAAAHELRQSVEAEVARAGYAAARELARPGAAREPLALLLREELLGELFARLRAEHAAAAGEPDALAALQARLARLGPLVAPLLARLAASEQPAERALAGAVLQRLEVRHTELLRSGDDRLRRFAAEQLFGLGDLARPLLERLRAGDDPQLREWAAVLLRRIEWAISEELYQRTGHLLPGFEQLPWMERSYQVFLLEKQGGAAALPTLRRILERDPSPGVRIEAAESLVQLGDPVGRAYLERIGLEPLLQSPEMRAAIAMDQGIRYLQIGRYEQAVREFQRVLELQPDNHIALYNLACAYSLMGDADRAIAHLEARDCGRLPRRRAHAQGPGPGQPPPGRAVPGAAAAPGARARGGTRGQAVSATAVDSQPRLAEVFLVMHAERRSGTLKVTDGAGASCYLYFRDGVVQHVRSARARAPIGRALVKRRKLEEGELERALALHRQTGEKLGRCCVKAGLVREEDIREALVFQALEEVTELFTWERPHCAFFPRRTPAGRVRLRRSGATARTQRRGADARGGAACRRAGGVAATDPLLRRHLHAVARSVLCHAAEGGWLGGTGAAAPSRR
ncbi:MAG: hypothetical protein KatS3mg102_0864 [Planctomycetota bacterium]|nr:MAG: hypothetical protein KatS3mg102_0864 [Planctomycetota bacterium]